jgi:hypothetical protein
MRVRDFALVVVVAGLALIAAACGDEGDDSAAMATPTPSAEGGGELTREQAIQRVVEMLAEAPVQFPDASTATARRMTECEAYEMMGWEGAPRLRPPTPLSGDPVWLVEVRGEFSGFIGYRLTPNPSPPLVGKWIQIVRVDGTDGGAGLPDERIQEGPELSRESILERALDEVAPLGSENQPDPSTAVLTQTTFGEALETLRREGAPQDFSEREGPDSPVWLFEVKGQFVSLCPGLLRSGRYFLVLALDGFVESVGFIPDATP